MKLLKKIGIGLGVIGTSVIGVFAGCNAEASYKQIKEAVQYPDAYLIEYEVVGEDGTITYVAKGKDGEGNYYYKDALTEYIFDLNGENYAVYSKVNGAWLDNGTVKEKYIAEATKGFAEYSEKSREKFLGAYKQGEEKAVSGRKCDTYTLELTIVNFEQTYEMAVDRETGVCTSYVAASKVNGANRDESGFMCVKFETENLDFDAIFEAEE